jgi:hypothetical protein
MVRRSWENKIYGNLLPSKNELKQIVFYDHSLGEQDHSYFQSLFDFYDIYNSNIILKFCFGFHHEIFKQVYNLIHKYGESFSNKAHGYNLLHKLLLEERLRLIVV